MKNIIKKILREEIEDDGFDWIREIKPTPFPDKKNFVVFYDHQRNIPEWFIEMVGNHDYRDYIGEKEFSATDFKDGLSMHEPGYIRFIYRDSGKYVKSNGPAERYDQLTYDIIGHDNFEKYDIKDFI